VLVIAEKLVELRKAQGLSQQEISDLLGVPRGTYSIWETGQRRPGLDSLIQIADFYSISVDFLLGREGVTAAASRADDPMSDLPPEARKSVEEFIEFFRKLQRENKK
jgi:transcriptional regulator with XRE-family HTH domain